MNAPQQDRPPKVNRRKEARYKTSVDQRLHCRTSVDEPGQDQICEGIAVDISPSGVRLLNSGSFQVGQPIWTELMTTRSHGVYRGNIRRIEPWVGGQLILGCSLRDIIPGEVLHELAREGIINRRSDGRYSISHPAKISWPLCSTEIDVEIQDYSSGGMKLKSREPIPNNARLRFRFDADGQEVNVEAKSIWSRQVKQDWITGVAFADPHAPSIVVESLGKEVESTSESEQNSGPGKTRQVLTFGAVLALVGYVILKVF